MPTLGISIRKPAYVQTYQTPANLLTGEIPKTYDPNWRKYNKNTGGALTPAQDAAFRAMPESCQQAAHEVRHSLVLGLVPRITIGMTLAQVQAALTTAATAVAQPFATEATVIANIGKTIHTMDDVEKAFNSLFAIPPIS